MVDPFYNILGEGEVCFSQFYEPAADLGEGAFGVVRKVKDVKSGRIFACKFIVKKGNKDLIKQVKLPYMFL